MIGNTNVESLHAYGNCVYNVCGVYCLIFLVLYGTSNGYTLVSSSQSRLDSRPVEQEKRSGVVLAEAF